MRSVLREIQVEGLVFVVHVIGRALNLNRVAIKQSLDFAGMLFSCEHDLRFFGQLACSTAAVCGHVNRGMPYALWRSDVVTFPQKKK